MTLAAALASVVAALFYARQTVDEARLTRREDERDRALRRVERIGELLSEVASGAEHGNWFLLWNSQKLLAITLAAVRSRAPLYSTSGALATTARICACGRRWCLIRAQTTTRS
jgi:hypothetical protein